MAKGPKKVFVGQISNTKYYEQNGVIVDDSGAPAPPLLQKSLLAGKQESDLLTKQAISSSLASAISPQSISAESLQQISGPVTSDKTIKNIEELSINSKKLLERSDKTVALLQQIKDLNQKNFEENKELFSRLLEASDAARVNSEEVARKGGVSGFKKSASGVPLIKPSTETDGGNKGGGITETLKNLGMLGLEGYAAYKMAGGGKGGTAAAKGMTEAEKAALARGQRMAAFKRMGIAGLAGGLVGGLYGAATGQEDPIINALGGAAVGMVGSGLWEGGKAVANKLTTKGEESLAKKAESEVASKAAAKGEQTVAAKAGEDALKGAAEAAKSKVAATSEKQGAKIIEKVTPEIIKTTVAKSAEKVGIGTIAKKIPVVGALAGLYFGVKRAMEGDFAGAGAEVVSGVAGSTGVGTVGSLAIDAGLIARDVYRDLYGIFPEDDQPDLRSTRMNEIASEVTNYISDLVKSNNEKEKTAESKINATPTEPKPNTQPGVTPDTDMGFQIEGRKEFDRGLVNNQAATPGVTPETSGIMPSVGGEYEAPKKVPEAKISPKAMFEAEDSVQTYMKKYENYLDSAMTVTKPEVSAQELVEKANDFSQNLEMHRAFTSIPTDKRKELDSKKLQLAERKLKEKRISLAESSDKGNLGSNEQTAQITPEMEAARASDEGSLGLITQQREVSPEMETNFIQSMRAERRRKFGPNSMGLDAIVEDAYEANSKKNALPTADQIAASKLEQLETPEKPQSGAPIIINKQGDVINNNHTTTGGSNSAPPAGSPSRIPNPYDEMLFGKPWSYTP